MPRTIRFFTASNAPTEEEQTDRTVVVVHSLWEAAEAIYNIQLQDELADLGVSQMYCADKVRRQHVEEVYYQLVTKKPIFDLDTPQPPLGAAPTQLPLRF